MNDALKLLYDWSTFASFLVAVLGALATVGAKTFSQWLSRSRAATISSEVQAETATSVSATAPYEVAKRWRTQDSASPSLVARSRVVDRITEAATSRQEQLGIQTWSKVAANLLTIAQYIIGGVLASSFVQQALAPKWVGGLGVLVLIASLFKQQYHPEINAEDARRKASKLKALIRSVEDQLAVLDAKIIAGQDHSDAMIALLTHATQKLTEIENPESLESTPQLPAK